MTVTAAGAAAVVAHVQSGHANAASWPLAMVALQSAHFIAAGGWLGGLAGLLVGIGRRAGAEAAAAARRYAVGAGVALAVLVATGMARALDEVGVRKLITDGDPWSSPASPPANSTPDSVIANMAAC